MAIPDRPQRSSPVDLTPPFGWRKHRIMTDKVTQPHGLTRREVLKAMFATIATAVATGSFYFATRHPQATPGGNEPGGGPTKIPDIATKTPETLGKPWLEEAMEKLGASRLGEPRRSRVINLLEALFGYTGNDHIDANTRLNDVNGVIAFNRATLVFTGTAGVSTESPFGWLVAAPAIVVNNERQEGDKIPPGTRYMWIARPGETGRADTSVDAETFRQRLFEAKPTEGGSIKDSTLKITNRHSYQTLRKVDASGKEIAIMMGTRPDGTSRSYDEEPVWVTRITDDKRVHLADNQESLFFAQIASTDTNEVLPDMGLEGVYFDGQPLPGSNGVEIQGLLLFSDGEHVSLVDPVKPDHPVVYNMVIDAVGKRTWEKVPTAEVLNASELDLEKEYLIVFNQLTEKYDRKTDGSWTIVRDDKGRVISVKDVSGKEIQAYFFDRSPSAKDQQVFGLEAVETRKEYLSDGQELCDLTTVTVFNTGLPEFRTATASNGNSYEIKGLRVLAAESEDGPFVELFLPLTYVMTVSETGTVLPIDPVVATNVGGGDGMGLSGTRLLTMLTDTSRNVDVLRIVLGTLMPHDPGWYRDKQVLNFHALYPQHDLMQDNYWQQGILPPKNSLTGRLTQIVTYVPGVN